MPRQGWKNNFQDKAERTIFKTRLKEQFSRQGWKNNFQDKAERTIFKTRLKEQFSRQGWKNNFQDKVERTIFNLTLHSVGVCLHLKIMDEMKRWQLIEVQKGEERNVSVLTLYLNCLWETNHFICTQYVVNPHLDDMSKTVKDSLHGTATTATTSVVTALVEARQHGTSTTQAVSTIFDVMHGN